MNYKGFELTEIRDKFKQLWKQLKEKYPTADGSIHFSYKGEFAPINDSFVNLIKKNSYLFLDGEPRSSALSLLKTHKDPSEEDFRKILFKAELNPDCRIVVLWDELDYDLIAELQRDALVNQELTPKTRASISIVLGIIGTKE